ncbi:AraC family transcriptional regulator [Chitinophaga sp. Cy-1792]|uniref:helix-turn-helix domain-containing protein n=1 Tax=Chitinophaga sp. Cy-1792 TaxID=2608339 RepID=UPI0014226DAB|nr:AraC family transcriptional regulator [Chitinophaga sp. Cy-1792]NIG55744.1 helix-turn-helix domain-containing protein [Chitinophaga sp. Cy-1792]
MKSGEITTCILPVENENFQAATMDQFPEKLIPTGIPVKLGFYVLLLTEKGRPGITIDGQAIAVSTPAVICARPGSIMQWQKTAKLKGYMICFTANFFSVRYNNNALSGFAFLESANGGHLPLNTIQHKTWNTLLEQVMLESNQQHKNRDSILRSYLNIMLCMFDRERPAEVVLTKRNIREEKIRQFKSMLDEHFILHKAPSFYAGCLNITTNYLNKLCKQQEGLSCGAMIRRRVTIEAQRLLHYTADPITDIAHQLEFEQVSYFITFFKKNVGVTPEHYRKNN